VRTEGPDRWTSSSSPEPKERQEGESRKAYLAFETYRDMVEEPRSYRKVAAELHKSLALIGRWGRAWRWQTRLNAYLKHLQDVTARERVRAITEMNERHASVAKHCLEKISETLNSLNGDPVPLAVLAKLLTASVTVERLAMGLTPESVQDGGSRSCPSHARQSAPFTSLNQEGLERTVYVEGFSPTRPRADLCPELCN
jgi:hypothetical protein